MSAVDLRGFRYALEPLLRRQRWRLEAQQLKLAALQGEIEREAERQRALEQDCRQRAEEGARALSGRLDLAAHQRNLAYLARQREDIAQGAAGLERLRERRRELRELCLQLQRKLDLLEQHRTGASAEYRLAESHRQAGEMDQEWIARSVWRAQAGERAS